MKIGLTIMRMQPLHNIHQHIIDTMLVENDFVYIVIGSIDKKDARNPFSFAERKKMIEDLYPTEVANNKIGIIGLKDINNPPKWVDYVLQNLEVQPDVYYCGQDQDADLFLAKGIKVCQFNRSVKDISGTKIRNKIMNRDKSWLEEVPEQIHQIILENKISGDK